MMRIGWIMLAAIATLGIGLPAVFHPAPRLIWNASASVPIGPYAVRPAGRLSVGELVVVTPPEPLASFLAARRYLPKGVPLLKHILALPGQVVCRAKLTIITDGVAVGKALDRDHLGRALPTWQGCHVVATGEVFLMNPLSADSLDSRYFGLLPATTIVGRADPVWIRARN
jgi:conjugative transfer signal peptidase TraF